MSEFTISNPVNESDQEDFNRVLNEGMNLVAAMAIVGVKLLERGVDIKSPHC